MRYGPKPRSEAKSLRFKIWVEVTLFIVHWGLVPKTHLLLNKRLTGAWIAHLATKMSITVRHDIHCQRINAARNKTLIVPSCSSNQFTPRYQFSLKSDKVNTCNIFPMAAILKKNCRLLIVPSICSLIQTTPRYQFPLKSDKDYIFSSPCWRQCELLSSLNASVVVRPSDVNFSKNLLLWNYWADSAEISQECSSMCWL